MVSAKHRTSFALDQETIRLIQHLAAQWHVSQAEVVRRAVRITAEGERSSAFELQERLSDYQDAGWIAAAAIVSKAELSTENTSDFAPFISLGLRLVPA